MADPTKRRRRFTVQQKAEAVEVCLQEGLSCNADARRLGCLHAAWPAGSGRASLDRGQSGPRDHGLISSEERAELNWRDLAIWTIL